MKVAILIVIFFCLACFCEGQMAKQGMPTLTQQKKPSPFGDPKELIFREDKGRWITVYPQDNGILNWLSEDYLHRVLVTHRSKFNDVSAFMIPKEYRGKVALFSGISKDEKTLKLLIIPSRVVKGQPEKLLEIAIHIKLSLSSAVTVDWEVLRELPLPSSADPSQKTTWKYLLSAQHPSSSEQQTAAHQIKTLYLVAKDKVVLVHYRKWQVIGTQPIPRADITSAVVMPDSLYLASQAKTGEGKKAPTSVDIFKLAGTRKEISLSKVAMIPENKIHQLCYVQWNGNPSICNWFYMDIESDTHILSIHDIVQQAAASHGPVTLSTNTSIVFTDFASLPYDMLIAHGPLDAPIGLGGFILRKFKTRPVPEISSDVKFVDFNLLPRLAVQLKEKGTTGRVVFGSITRRGYSELVFYTYNMDKEPKQKKINEQQEDVTLVDTPKNKAELIAEMQEVPNVMWPQPSNRKLLEFDEEKATETRQRQQPQQQASTVRQGRNFTQVSMKIVLDEDFLGPDNHYDDSLPFSCKEQGCGPDVKCPDATPTTQCFLYNDAFLCCHQSPFG